MKYIKSYLFLVLTAALALAGCKQDDLQDDVDALGNRVTLLEEQVKILNDNIETLSFVLDMNSMKTVQNVEEQNGVYVITLSDGSTLNLTVGVQGEVALPEISVSDDGYWMIGDNNTGVSAVGEPGADGSGYPEFRVNGDKWQVRFVDNAGVAGEWNDVAGGANTGIGTVGDQLIESAEVTGNELVITYYTDYANGKTETVSVPIVPDLYCEIETPTLESDGCLQIEKGSYKEVKVKASSEPQLTWPAGWRASIEEITPETDGYNYLLTIYELSDAASTQTNSRASADNSTDVTLRVTNGTYWAVSKIKVKVGEGGEPEKTPYEKYEAGETITIGSYKFDKEDGLTATYVTSNTTVSENTVTNNTVYFIEPGVILTFSSASVTNVNTVIFVSAKEGERAEVKTSVNGNVSFRAGATTNFIAKDINFSSTTHTHFMDLNSSSRIENFILEGCKVNVSANQHLLHGGAKGAVDNAVGNIELVGNDIAFNTTADWQGCRILNFQDKKSSANVTVTGNVFYSTNGDYNVNGTVLTANTADCTGEILIKDNTFINYLPTSQQLIRGKMSADTKITIQNCLFYSNYKKSTEPTDGDNTKDTSNNSLINPSNGVPTQPVVTEDDIKFYNRGDGTVTFRLWSSVPSDMSQITFTALSTPPLTDIDYTNGTFTKASGYENCGATR